MPESQVTAIPASLEQGPFPTGRAIPWGRAHHAAFLQRYRRTASISIHTSELSDDANRVELSSTLKDDFGIPAPRVVYQRRENTIRTLAFGVERGTELLEAAGAARIVAAGWDVDGIGRGAAPGHYMGTARMGSDPKRSVVDKWGRSHEVPNLLIIDGSIFPTSGVTEPTSTIQANALRIADYVSANRKQLIVSGS
jgi:choline dehydrogenase-like flavoprotein